MFKSTTQIEPSNPPKNPIVASLLSLFLLGGVGQLYLGQQKKGIILIGVAILGMCITLGLGTGIVMLIGAIDAYTLADKLQQGEAIGDMQWFWE